jgi:hypothetical protein
MALSYDDLLNYIGSNKSLEDRFYTDEGGLSSQGGVYGYGANEYGPLSGLLNSNQTTYRTYDIPGAGRFQFDPTRQTFNQFENRNGSTGMYNPGSSGQNYTEISKDGTTQKQSIFHNGLTDKIGGKLPVVVPALMAMFGGAAAMGAGSAGAGAAAGAAEGAGGFAALPAGGMTATGTAAPWATSAGGLGTLGSGTYGATTAGVGSLMGTAGGGGALGTGLAGATTAGLGTTGGSMFGLDSLFGSGGDMWGKALDFATSKGGSALLGGLLGGSSSGPDNLTSTSQNKMDPRMDPYVYGQGGILNQIMAQSGKQQAPGMANFGANIDDYLNDWGPDTFRKNQQAAQGLQGSNISAPQVNAPSQNNLNLSPAYQDMIYGQAGANPYLTGAIQKGINQSTNAFGNYMTDATKATTDLLGNIRGGAVMNNTLGGNRQGIAEGRALSDLSSNLTRAATQFGQNNTDAAVSAQAGAYDADRNRALSAMTGLGGQQYQTAITNAQLQADTNRLNSQNQIAGIGLSNGLLGQAYGIGQQQDQYSMGNLKDVSGLLSQYTGLNNSNTQSQPLYQNQTGNVLGGAMAGLGLWNAFNQPTR